MALRADGLLIGDGIGAIRRASLAAMLLLRNMLELAPGHQGKRFTETRRSTAQGAEYDLYEPTGGVRSTVIVVQGLVILGERDPRMINFARALASGGVRAAAIHLPALSECRFAASDLSALVDLAQSLYAESQQPLGLVAFSFGAGMALAAATDPGAKDLLDPLLLFGPYYSLSELWDEIGKNFKTVPKTKAQWDDHIWLRMLIAYRDRERLDFSAKERAELTDLLGRYCSEPSLERKRRFYEKTIKPREPLVLNREGLDPEVLDWLSPQGKLAAIGGRVLLLHDPNDPYVSPEHSRQILRELGGRKNFGRHRLLITPLLSHVLANFTWKIFEVFPLLGIVGELFRQPCANRANPKGKKS